MTDPARTGEAQARTWAAEAAAERSDVELLLGLRAHQRAALQELYTRYFPPTYAVALRMLDDPAAAEECVQVVFLQLGQHPFPNDPTQGDVCAWLLQAIHQQARSRQRLSPARPQPAAAEPPSPAAEADPPTGPGRLAACHRLAEARQSARDALATLPPVERTVLELAYFRGRTLAEIAASLSESPGTVQTQLRAGLDRLSAALADGVAPVEHLAMSPPGPPPSPLVQLADALAGMEAAQQQAADLRHRARDVQRRADLAQQRAASQQQASSASQQLAVLQELYAYLDTALADRPQAAEQSFAHTEAYFAQHPKNIAVSQVIAILSTLDAQSDSEAHQRLPVLLH